MLKALLMKMKVAVIGAGAAGLSALQHLTACNTMQVVCYEQTSNIGGTWVYTEKTGTDDHGLPIHSSMYRDLRTNLPVEVMSYLDYPFVNKGQSFVHHTEVLKYLNDYAQHFNLKKFIKFQHHVMNVSREPGLQWRVKVHDLKNATESIGLFDAVVVCNGHLSKPYKPDIPGLETFKGKVMHSHDYRSPEPFQDLSVVLLGARASGQDIAIELAPYSKEIIISHNTPVLQCKLPATVRQRKGIRNATPDGFFFNDGSFASADVFMYCTGYEYTFPFLDSSCGLSVKDNCLSPLYKHCIYINDPSLCFIGLTATVIPFPLFDIQAKFLVAVLEKRATLPSKEEMLQDTNDNWNCLQKEGWGRRHGHLLSDKQWEYAQTLAELAGIEGYPLHIQKIYKEVHERRKTDLLNYRDVNFHLKPNGTY